MMVQGWRRYSWQQMAGVKPFEIKHFVEEGLPLWGRVLTLVGNKPRANVDLMFWMKNDSLKAEIHGKGHTDEKGNFYCILPDSVDITGKWTLSLSVSEDGKQKHSQVLLNRNFSPGSRRYTFYDTEVKDSLVLVEEETDSLHKPSIMEIQSLKEVQVKRYRPRKHLEPELVFDVDKDINGMLDEGKNIPTTVQEYAEWKYPILMNTDPFKIVVYLFSCKEEDAPKFRHIPVGEMDVTNVKQMRVYTKNGLEIIESLSSLNNITDSIRKGISDSRRTHYYLIVSELYDEVFNDTRKGIRQTYYSGYSKIRECYNLRTSDQAIGDIHYRRTLYWNPDVKTDATGKVNIRLYNNGTCRRMDVSAEGINNKILINR